MLLRTIESPISDDRQPKPLERGQPDTSDFRDVAAEEPPIGRGRPQPPQSGNTRQPIEMSRPCRLWFRHACIHSPFSGNSLNCQKLTDEIISAGDVRADRNALQRRRSRRPGRERVDGRSQGAEAVQRAQRVCAEPQHLGRDYSPQVGYVREE